jgi:hypothetical protein
MAWAWPLPKQGFTRSVALSMTVVVFLSSHKLGWGALALAALVCALHPRAERAANETWQEGARARPAAMAYSAGRVIATTESGPQVSTDDGKSFEVIANAPMMTLVSAGSGSEMVGLDTASFAWRSSDSGATWSRLGGLGEVQAIASFDAGSRTQSTHRRCSSFNNGRRGVVRSVSLARWFGQAASSPEMRCGWHAEFRLVR